MTPDEYCQQKAAGSGSSFYYAFLFLPPDRRRAITALYAFCREVDDVVDEAADPQVAGAKLAWWRQEVGRTFAGDPQHPVTRALQPALAAFGISAQRLNEVIDGMQMDLTQTRYLDFAALERYCYHVAGVVGLLAAGPPCAGTTGRCCWRERCEHRGQTPIEENRGLTPISR